jgi:RND family efflux transporter MFP subunit
MSLLFNYRNVLQLIAGIGLLIVGSCSSNGKKETQTGTDTVVIVTTSKPLSDTKQGLTVSGQVEAVQSANISTRVMGYVTRISAKVGDHVTKGQLLVTITNDDLLAKRAQADAMINEADAGYKNTQKDIERFTALYKQQSASAKELDNITLQYNSAKARLEAAKQMRNEVSASLSYTSLTAPFSGTVTQKMLDPGSMANPGMPILTIEQSGNYLVSALIPESEISLIHQAAAATITIGALNKVIGGRITQVTQSSVTTGGQYVIKVQIPDREMKGLFAGMYADLVIPVTQTIKNTTAGGRVMVPISAIEFKDQLTGLYTIASNGTALLRWVRLGKTNGNLVEVVSGLSANEQFIVNAEGRLYNGVSIKIKNENEGRTLRKNS